MSLDAIVWVMKHSEATLGARLVLLVLAEYAHEDGTKAFPKVPTIAEKARMSRKGVQTALRRLASDGHIACTGQTKSGTNVYSIVGMAAGDNSGETGDKRGEVTSARGEATSRRGEVTTPDPLDDPVKDPSGVEVVKAAWGKLSPPLPQHRDAYYRKAKVKTALKKAFEVYTPAEVAKSIENYVAILKSPDHFWEHRWTLQEFLDRGLDRFVDDADPLSNFRTAQSRDLDSAGGRQRSPADKLAAAEAWILNTAWRLPLEEFELAEQLGQRGIEGPDRSRLLELWRTKREALDAA